MTAYSSFLSLPLQTFFEYKVFFHIFSTQTRIIIHPKINSVRMTKVEQDTTITNADDILLNSDDKGAATPSLLLHNNKNDTSLEDDADEDDIFSRLEHLSEELSDIMVEGIQMRHLPDVPVDNAESNEIFFKLENLVDELKEIMVEGIKMDHLS